MKADSKENEDLPSYLDDGCSLAEVLLPEKSRTRRH